MPGGSARACPWASDDPDTRLGLLQVLTTTYNALNRFDYALPLAEEWVQLASQHLGPDAPATLLARLEQGHGLQINGMEGRAIAVLEPLRQPLRRQFGERSAPYRDALMMLAACYMHSQRLPEAEQALAQAWALTQKLGPLSALDRADYLNNLQVLRSKQGRQREALKILRESQPFWQSREPAHAMQILVMRRNFLNHQIGLAEFDDIEARSRQLLRDMDRVLGPGSDLALLQYAMLARYFSHTGQYAAAAAEYAALLAQAQAQGIAPHSEVLLRLRAEALLVRSRARLDAERPRWRGEARQLLADIEASGPLVKGNALNLDSAVDRSL
ncbi:tetratricopeptide (TPR) repeat protein [Paucibacter oligotrophus]|uniref:Tetratricopeptide (TPR) repeat protein n=1 Tax=Roseateles oligotrophus TaxID=1769250 RepID=A0A840LEM6_9BURK|nr:tetratricopeptide repeat protein [Roseateles oligotrophus]MBB4844648.1 tetratricopeptide (TPR) repeat protein [Roseateles oligotrophus]